VEQLLDPLGPQAVVDAGVRLAMANALHVVFLIACIAAIFALLSVFFTPHMDLKERSAIPAARPDEPVVTSMD
jgi:hypothetical protein